MNPLRQLALTTADIELLTATANRLYEAGQVGVKEAWSNPKSGNSGTVELLETFEREGLPCRRSSMWSRSSGTRSPNAWCWRAAEWRTGAGCWLRSRRRGRVGAAAAHSPAFSSSGSQSPRICSMV